MKVVGCWVLGEGFRVRGVSFRELGGATLPGHSAQSTHEPLNPQTNTRFLAKREQVKGVNLLDFKRGGLLSEGIFREGGCYPSQTRFRERGGCYPSRTCAAARLSIPPPGVPPDRDFFRDLGSPDREFV